ncbi:hypothetical protein AMTR_s00038p00221110, partial [Amborella trichopoda]
YGHGALDPIQNLDPDSDLDRGDCPGRQVGPNRLPPLEKTHIVDVVVLANADENFMANGDLEAVVDWIPGMPNIRLRDLPSFIGTTNLNDPMLQLQHPINSTNSLGVLQIAKGLSYGSFVKISYVGKDWGIGMEINNDVKREEVKALVRELMEGEKGREMQLKAKKWKEISKTVVQFGGSSYNNLERLIKQVFPEKR